MYFFSDRIILLRYKAKKIENHYINKILEEISKKAEIRQPKIYISEISIANIFVVGKNKRDSSVVITKNLLEKLNKEELKAVIAYSIACIKNDFPLIASMVSVIAYLIVGFAILIKKFFDIITPKKSKIGLIFFSVIVSFAALILQMTISRKDRFKADQKAVKLLEHPYALIEAMKKLDKEKAEGFEWSAHLFFVSPLAKHASVIFSTHPTTGERIRKLRKFWRKKQKQIF